MVSASSAGIQGNFGSYDAAISDDGNVIAFASQATNLVTADTNNADDIFVQPYPSFEITMSHTTYSNGDTITATEFRIKNPGITTPVNLRIWLTVPGVGAVDLVNVQDGSLQLPSNININIGPLLLFTVTSDFPPKGLWEFASQTSDPITKKVLRENRNPFTVQ